jgi:acetyl-CoA carboxylase biotin carboxyl carrier protein
MSWVKRVEAVLGVLKGSGIGEIELAEGELEIIIRRHPATMGVVKTHAYESIHRTNVQVSEDRFIPLEASLTGIYYTTPSPDTAPFITVGETVKVGQTIALIEAMKVFNEIQVEVAGRVVEIKAKNGEVVKKGDVLLLIDPI